MSERDLYHPAANLDRKHGFRDFTPFINIEGLSKKDAQDFKARLRKFYTETVNSLYCPPVFQPGSCIRCVDHFPTAEQLFKPWEVSLWFSKGYDHYWYKINIGSQKLIVDPSGFPKTEECVEEMKKYHTNLDFTGYGGLSAPLPPRETHNTSFVFRHYYVPFFGLEENATGYPAKAYKDPESFEVSRDWISRRINKIYCES